ncbi:adenylate/guanylate cyclase domain-containing protein [Fulvivirga aurantia]|uniref:adenylate/guanylate cyclase domain-containing protein n=1 Tax=Fulvivirga aurantia TaxID=2529383 RepID=UPI0012BCAED2
MERSRKLAAIMFTDMVGFTALMQEDETKAQTFRDRQRQVLTKAIKSNHGEIIQYYGDGTLSIFESAIEATLCAITIQEELTQEPKIPLRIGIHTGDIVQDREGIFGDGVNLASRIESLAVPGSVMISDKVFDEIKNHKNIKTRSMGSFELKNVRKPIEVYCITNGSLVVPRRDLLQGKVKERIKSVAVMPFVNMSADVDNEYFSDGITEELINALTKVDGLQVTSRTSSFSFKGQNKDIREIADKLNVQSVLEGSVRKAGKKVRITAQLINAGDGYHIWSETYDRSLEDIFEVQDEISRVIANKLRKKLSAEEKTESIVTQTTNNVNAYNYYLRGLYESNKWTPPDALVAIKYYKKAIEEEPDFALPYGKIASDYAFLGITGFMNVHDSKQKALEYGVHALNRNSDDIEALLALAMVKFFVDWDWEGALQNVLKAKEINVNSPHARIMHALYHMLYSEYELGIIEIEEALRIDPLSTDTNRTLADFYYFMGQYDEAIRLYNKILSFAPDFKAATEFKAWALLMKGSYDKAIALFKNMESSTVHAIKHDTQLGFAYALKGNKEKALKYLDKLDKAAKEEPDVSYNIDYATLYVGLSEPEKALDYLEKCVEERIGAMIFLDQSPMWRPLRGHKRFDQLVKKMGLPGQKKKAHIS